MCVLVIQTITASLTKVRYVRIQQRKITPINVSLEIKVKSKLALLLLEEVHFLCLLINADKSCFGLIRDVPIAFREN